MRLDNDDGHARNVVNGGTELRAHRSWSPSGNPALVQPPSEISGRLLERMIEGAMGDALQEIPRVGLGSKFGRSYVEAERACADVTNVELDPEDPFITFLNGFGDYFENTTLDHRCTDDPRVVGYGTTFLHVGP